MTLIQSLSLCLHCLKYSFLTGLAEYVILPNQCTLPYGYNVLLAAHLLSEA